MAEQKPESTGDKISQSVDRQARRKLKARREKSHSIWFGLGMFGLIGWAIAIPTLIGIALGLWIDRQWPGQVSWTLTLLFVGVALGCMNAWRWIGKERNHD